MSTPGDALDELRTTARVVLGQVEALEDRSRRGTLEAAELERLTRGVWLLQVDVELHAPAADPSSPSDLAALAAVREALDAAIATVTGLLERQVPQPRRRGR